MNKMNNKNTWLKYILPVFIFALMVSCSDNPTADKADISGEDEVSVMYKGSNSGQTAYTNDADGGTGEFTGYTDGVCPAPSYGVYDFTLWAGKTNDAGTVSITNDSENVYVTYQTNETADLGEVHVYVWTDVNDIPDKRPAPGQAPYTAEDINADSYTMTIPMEVGCGDVLYISTHAALVTDGRNSGDTGDDSNAGETAYAGGSNNPDGIASSKGAWWGYVTYTVTCFYDLAGTVYEDANNNSDFDNEDTFSGIEVYLLDSNGNVVATTTTDADGSYLFKYVEGGADYTVTTNSPEGDYLANENAGGFHIYNLDTCYSEIDFGFVPLYDLSGTVYEDANNNSDNDGETGFGGIVVNLLDGSGNVVASTTTDSNGNYLFENQLPGDYTVVVVSGPDGYTATENAGGASVNLTSDITGIDFGYYQEVVTYDPCDFNQDGTVSAQEYAQCNPVTEDNFPVWGQDISHVILVFDGAPAGDNDGYYTVKIDEWPGGADRDLDNSIDAIMAYLIANDANVDASSVLLGSSIKGGLQITSFYAVDGNPDADTPPAGLGFGYDGTKGNEYPQNAIDTVYLFGAIF